VVERRREWEGGEKSIKRVSASGRGKSGVERERERVLEGGEKGRERGGA
jgi:hypothetical protein